MSSRPLQSFLLGCALLAAGVPACAQQRAGATETFSCTTCDGNVLRSDRPIKECSNVRQYVLRNDGTVIRTIDPEPTPEERAEMEQQRKEWQAKKKAHEDAVRNDKLLVLRFPDAAAHQKDRDKALEPLRYAIGQSQARLADLERERKPLMDEAEFYRGRELPAKLKAQIDANDAAAAAQKELLQQQHRDLAAETAKYDEQLAHLKGLWAGKAPGWRVPPPAPLVFRTDRCPAGARAP